MTRSLNQRTSRVRLNLSWHIAVLAAWSVFAPWVQAAGQSTPACGPQGYRVLARQWDPVLNKQWDLRQECSHPDWPARLVAAGTAAPAGLAAATAPQATAAVPQTGVPQTVLAPLLVHAGDPVRLWMQDQTVRIEMNGVAEASARSGERVTVRITRQTEENGLEVQRIPGVVRGQGDVEMER
jgi:hypothetical protein